ncbi:Rho-type GTPase-activating protein [Scheffersomyces xylosifermentans]|uniref:Rho-type GTPase-activating protein n=1 Tax=Scheffersomyces xylosifermentans TaxID=1304137 RepID=UPI00315CF172
MTDISITNEVTPTEPEPNFRPHDSQPCKKCNQPIFEGHAYELGDDRWHLDCFKCSKCDSSLGCNSNFLVLGNGNLICSNCSYNCKQCGKKIDDLAILTGDQAYCSNCFKCRSCKMKIEDLRYARTSKGLFCMECHEKLMAKKKKYDAKKKQLALLQQKKEEKEREREREKERELEESRRSNNSSRNSILQTYLSNGSNSHLHSSSNTDITGNSLSTASGTNNTSHFDGLYSQHNKSSSSVLSRKKTLPAPPHSNPVKDVFSAPDNDFSIEEVVDSDDEDITANRASLRPQRDQHISLLHRKSPPPFFDNENRIDRDTKGISPTGSNVSNGTSVFMDIANDPTTPTASELQPAIEIPKSTESVNVQPSVDDIEESTHPATGSTSNGNILILSPSQYHDHEFHTTNSPGVDISRATASPTQTISSSSVKSSTLNAHTDEAKARSGCPSPFAKANRQARVVETNDYIPTDGIDDLDYTSMITTPQKNKQSMAGSTNLTSPPPKVPLPSTPTKSGFQTLDGTPKGLGLEGISYGDAANAGTPEERYIKHQQQQLSQQYRNSRTSDEDVTLTPSQSGSTTATSATPRERDASYGNKSARNSRVVGSSVSSLSRMNTLIKTPKLSLKHKRSASGGSTTSSKFPFFNGSKKEEGGIHMAASAASASRGHSRHVSDGSVSNGSAFTTPPLPISTPSTYGRVHVRSTSDTPFLTSLENDGLSGGSEEDFRALRDEIASLTSQKSALNSECRRLAGEKTRLNELLAGLQTKISNDTAIRNDLVSDIEELEAQKRKLVDYNYSLMEQTRKIESSSDSYGATMSMNRVPSSEYTSNDSTPTGTTIIGGVPFIELPDDSAETNRATRLKFWRRAKFATPNLVQTNFNQGSNSGQLPISQPHSQSSSQPQSMGHQYNGSIGSNKISQSYSSQAIRLPGQSGSTSSNGYSNGSDSSGSGEKRPKVNKSRSNNLLDNLLTNGGEPGLNDLNSPAPLFSSTIQKRADFENVPVPMIITKCLAEVELRGLDTEGIYRISGGNSAIVAIEHAFANLPLNPTNDERAMQKLEDTINGDINAVTSALKRYFRKLPDPLIPYNLYDDFIKVSSSNNPNKMDKRVSDLKSKVINKLPSANKHTLYLLCKHLSLVSSYSAVNRMNFKNLSVVFAPTIARDETGQKEMIDMGFRNETTEVLLNHSEKIFQDYKG